MKVQPRLGWLLLGSALGSLAHAQMAQPTAAPARAQAASEVETPAPVRQGPEAPEHGNSVRIRLDARVDVTDSRSPPSGRDGAGRDVVLHAIPSIQVSSRGANTRIEGQFQFDKRNSRKMPDRVLPSGNLDLHSELARSGLGLEAGVRSDQVRADATSQSCESLNSSDCYVQTTTRIAPFFKRDLDADTQFAAQAERRNIHTTQTNVAQQRVPNETDSKGGLSLTRQPKPLGYGVEWHDTELKRSDRSTPLLGERLARVKVTYALLQELTVGLSGGAGRDRVGEDSGSETVRGALLEWRPTERTVAKGEIEQRYFGKGWLASLTHYHQWMTLEMRSERTVTTQANLTQGTDYGPLAARIGGITPGSGLATGSPIGPSLGAGGTAGTGTPVTSLGGNLYDAEALLRQSNSVALSFPGRRNLVSIFAAQIKSRPLTPEDVRWLTPPSALLPVSPTTRELDWGAELRHQLSRYTALLGGLRVSRVRSTAAGTGITTTSKDVAWHTEISTLLSQQTNASMGFQRELTRAEGAPGTGFTHTDLNTVFVGLGHRF